jgi:hypothetical protein
LSGVSPELRPPVTPADSDDGDEPLPSEEDAEQVAGPVPTARPADAPVDLEAIVPVGVKVQPQAIDACVSDSSWRANATEVEMPAGALAEEGSAPTANAAAAATLIFLLGGGAGAHRAETESRRHRGFRR